MAWAGASRVVVEAESRGKGGADMRLFEGQHIHQGLSDKQVYDDDQNRGAHDRLRGGAASALSPSAGGHAVEAAHRGDDEAEQDRLYQSHEDILKHQRLPGIAPILAGVEVEKKFGHD